MRVPPRRGLRWGRRRAFLGVKISPDSSVVAVVVHNGSSRAKESPFFNPAGKLVMVRVTGQTLARVGQAPIGRWSQGAASTGCSSGTARASATPASA
ncbi:MAG TPA: hypothetical protein VFV05_07235 [Methylomirabilota bacterium]|nr:hypothetical protein [Methylomirabilota bacterium]